LEPEVTLAELFHAAKVVPSDINQHLQYMHDICVEVDALQVVELGVRSGLSTIAFLSAMEATGGSVWSCDIDQPRLPDVVSQHDRWSFVWGDDMEMVDEAPECDVLFIDTSHGYLHTLAELNAYSSKVAKIILLHDTQLEAPDSCGPQPPFPVRKAALEWWAAHPEWMWEEFEHCFGLGVLRRTR